MNWMRYNVISVLLGLFVCIHLQAQHTDSLKIKEALVQNDESEKYETRENAVIPQMMPYKPVLLMDAGKISDTDERLENYKKYDGCGIGMTITAMGVVLLGLIGLYLLFNLIGGIAVSLSHKRAMKTFGISKQEAKDITKQSGDIYAAIAMAIYEATELHDEENTILTIKNTVRNYSPWSSKIYTLRERPKR